MRKFQISHQTFDKFASFYPFAHVVTAQDTDLRGPDAHETIQGLNGHLLGGWGGKRSQLEERG